MEWGFCRIRWQIHFYWWALLSVKRDNPNQKLSAAAVDKKSHTPTTECELPMSVNYLYGHVFCLLNLQAIRWTNRFRTGGCCGHIDSRTKQGVCVWLASVESFRARIHRGASTWVSFKAAHSVSVSIAYVDSIQACGATGWGGDLSALSWGQVRFKALSTVCVDCVV